MAIHLIRTRPDSNDYTPEELADLVARRRAQNEKVMALAMGEADCVPIYDPVPVIPGLPNNQTLSDEDFRTDHVLHPWLAERNLQNSIHETGHALSNQVTAQRNKLFELFRIKVPANDIPGYFPGEDRNILVEFADASKAEMANLQAENEADADLWWSVSARYLAAMSELLQSLGKDLTWLLETDHMAALEQ